MTEARATSYINNLHPQRHGRLYDLISLVVARAIPLWDATLSLLQDDFVPRPRIEMERDYENNNYEPEGSPGPEYASSDDDDAINQAFEEWEESRLVRQPEPAGFKTAEQRMDEKYSGQSTTYRSRKGPLNLRKEYGKLQIIVKLANIHLTPEKPEYEGGSWHVEGQLNEHMYEKPNGTIHTR